MEGKVYFVFKHKGFSYVFVTHPEPHQIGICLKVKDATWHAIWVFIPTRDFMAAQAKSYERFCFGCSRRVAVSNFVDGFHRVFQSSAPKSYQRSGVAPSKEVQDHG